MNDFAYIALFLVIGVFLAIHCSRATMREWKKGEALGGRWGDYERESSSLGFWLIITGNALAAAMGCAFFLFGALYLVTYLGWIE